MLVIVSMVGTIMFMYIIASSVEKIWKQVDTTPDMFCLFGGILGLIISGSALSMALGVR